MLRRLCSWPAEMLGGKNNCKNHGAHSDHTDPTTHSAASEMTPGQKHTETRAHSTRLPRIHRTALQMGHPRHPPHDPLHPRTPARTRCAPWVEEPPWLRPDNARLQVGSSRLHDAGILLVAAVVEAQAACAHSSRLRSLPVQRTWSAGWAAAASPNSARLAAAQLQEA